MALSLLVACSSPGTSSGTDAGDDQTDTGSVDTDSGSEETDSGSEDVDSGSEGVDAGPPACLQPGLGDSCGDTAGGAECMAGFECDLGRCLPQDRDTCGGIAGAPCTDPVRSECLYQVSHGDVGTCLSEGEVRCLCSRDSTHWRCD